MTNQSKPASIRNDTTTRRYRLDDIPRLVSLAVEYIPQLPKYRTVTIDASRVDFLLQNNVNNESAFMLRVLCDSHDRPVGAMVAYCTTMFFSWDKAANDIFLFIEPEWRTLQNARKLLKIYIQWALMRDAKIIDATVTSGIEERAMDRIMIDMGFNKLGTLYRYGEIK